MIIVFYTLCVTLPLSVVAISLVSLILQEKRIVANVVKSPANQKIRFVRSRLLPTVYCWAPQPASHYFAVTMYDLVIDCCYYYELRCHIVVNVFFFSLIHASPLFAVYLCFYLCC
jgi:hypothetical protein